jgi:hypothetical protein
MFLPKNQEFFSLIDKLGFSGMLSLPQRGRGTAQAVDEEVALLWVSRLL